MQKLKAIVASLEDAPESVRGCYVKRDGKFMLAVEGVDDLPEIGNLKRAYERVKEKLKGGNTPDAVDNDFSDPNSALRRRAKELDPEGAAALEALEARLANIGAEQDAKIARQDETIRRLTIDRAITASLDAAGVRPQMLKVAAALFRDDCELSSSGEVLIATKFGRVPLGRKISRWASGPDGRHFVDPARVRRDSSAAKFGAAPSGPAPAAGPSFAALAREIQEA